MRLLRLDLTRYGRFTEDSLDFPPPAPGAPDLHVVYGANGAGKSTAFAAWLDLLYGIEPRSPFNFLHRYETMQIGAVIVAEGRQMTLLRTKRQKNALVDGSGAPVPEGTMAALTGGIDRAGYAAMFSLDRLTLERGGEDILDSKGNLGEMLFSASAGLAGLTDRLARLRERADAFHSPGKRAHALAQAKAALADLDMRRREIDIDAARFRALREAVETAGRAHAAASAAHAQTVADLDATRRVLTALPHLARLAGAEAALVALPDVPPVPEGWAAELAAMDRREAEVTALAGQAAVRAAELERARDSAAPDPPALEIADAVAAAGGLRSAQAEAVKDLPRRRDEAEALTRALAEAARALGQHGRPAADLRLPADRIAALREAVAQRAEAAATLVSAEAEAEAAQQAWAEARAQLPEEDTEDGDTDALSRLLARLRDRDPGQARRAAAAAADRSAEALARRMAALRPFRGDADALAALDPPAPAALADLAARIATAEASLAAATAEARQGAEAARQQEAALAARAAPSGGAEAAALRADREALWAAHRQRLTAASADAFEAAMRADDLAMAERAEQRAETVWRHRAEAELAQARRTADLAETARRDAARQRDARLDERDRLRRALSPDLPAGMDGTTLRDWLLARDEALEAAAQHRAAEADVARAGAEEAEAAAALSALLGAGAAGLPYDALLALAATRIEASARGAARREALRKAAADRARRRAALDAAQAARDRADQDWQRLCAGTWIAPDLSPGAATGLLDRLVPLEQLVAQHADLTDRIAKMETNVAAFAAAVQPLAVRAGIVADDPARAWDALQRRVAEAGKARDARAQAIAEMSRLDVARQALAVEHQQIRQRRAAMAAHFSTDDPARLGALMNTAQERARHRATAAEALRDLSQALALPPDAARATAEAADRAALDQAAAALAARRDELDAARQESYAGWRAAQGALYAAGGDDAVARLDSQLATLTLDLRERTEAHLRLRFGLIALDHALISYRETHRSGMLAQASAAFAAITGGAYRGLAVQPHRSGDALVALPQGGGSERAAELSDGTRAQLYLALRIAGYHEFAATRATVPFVADDILETFDDDRAACTFARLAEMARLGQVIYLTHHAHLCEIAQRVCPSVRLHRLEPPPAAPPAPQSD